MKKSIIIKVFLFLLSILIALNFFLDYIPTNINLLLGFFVIGYFINSTVKSYFYSYFPLLQNKKTISFMMIIYSCFGSFFSTYYFFGDLFRTYTLIQIVLGPVIIFGFIEKKYFCIYSTNLLLFYDKMLLGKQKVFSDVLDPYGKIPKGKTRTIAKFLLEITPGMTIGFFIVICFCIGIIISLNSLFYLILTTILLIYSIKLGKNNKEAKRLSEATKHEEHLFSFIEQIFTLKGFSGVIVLISGLLLYILLLGSQILLFLNERIEQQFSMIDIIRDFIVFPLIPLLIFILFFFYRLSLRYGAFIKTYFGKEKDIKEKILAIRFGGEKSLCIYFFVFICYIFLQNTYPRYQNEQIFVYWTVATISLWIFVIVVIILTLFSQSDKNMKNLKFDNYRIPIVSSSAPFLISIVMLVLDTPDYLKIFSYIIFGIILLELYFIDDWIKFLDRRNIDESWRYIYLILPFIIPISLIICMVPDNDLKIITFSLLIFIVLASLFGFYMQRISNKN